MKSKILSFIDFAQRTYNDAIYSCKVMCEQVLNIHV